MNTTRYELRETNPRKGSPYTLALPANCIIPAEVVEWIRRGEAKIWAISAAGERVVSE